MSVIMKAEHLSGGYEKETVLKEVDLEIEEGEFFGIIGPNGSGKSTLLRFMSRALFPESGKILFQGKNILGFKRRELSRKIAFVPQETAINFSFTVFEIVLMGRIPHLGRLQTETRDDFQIAEKALFMTDTSHLKDKKIDELSSGERQRVLIAKALAQEPELLFLDEPTSHLDIGHQVQILNLLKDLNKKQRITVVIVLHDLNLASEYCDKMILLHQGRIYSCGEPEKLITYQNLEAVYKTLVLVNKNPVSSKPFVMLVSAKKNEN